MSKLRPGFRDLKCGGKDIDTDDLVNIPGAGRPMRGGGKASASELQGKLKQAVEKLEEMEVGLKKYHYTEEQVQRQKLVIKNLNDTLEKMEVVKAGRTKSEK